jgi:hypothetical protein
VRTVLGFEKVRAAYPTWMLLALLLSGCASACRVTMAYAGEPAELIDPTQLQPGVTCVF